MALFKLVKFYLLVRSPCTPHVLEFNLGFALWEDVLAFRVHPGKQLRFDLSDVSSYGAAGMFCLNQIKLRIVPKHELEREGLKPMKKVAKADELGSGGAAFHEVQIEWVDDETLERIINSFDAALSAVGDASAAVASSKRMDKAGEEIKSIAENFTRSFDAIKVTGCKNRHFDIYPYGDQERGPKVKIFSLAK